MTCEWINKKCKHCGKEFSIRKSEEFEDRNGKIYERGIFCSRECWRLSKVGKPTVNGKTWKHTKEYCEKLSRNRLGKLNPAYIHGGYVGKARGKNSEMKEWRSKIFGRDKYACKICGSKNGYLYSITLNAHHICPFAVFRDMSNDINNGVTLCKDCHVSVHKELRKEVSASHYEKLTSEWYKNRFNDISKMQRNNIRKLKKTCVSLANRCIATIEHEQLDGVRKFIIENRFPHNLAWYEKKQEELEDILFHHIQ